MVIHGFHKYVELRQGTPCKECITLDRKEYMTTMYVFHEVLFGPKHGDVAAALPPKIRGFLLSKVAQTGDSYCFSWWNCKNKQPIGFLRIYQTRGRTLHRPSFFRVGVCSPKWSPPPRKEEWLNPWRVGWINHSWCLSSLAQEGSLRTQSRHSFLLPQQRGMGSKASCTPLSSPKIWVCP